jgi:hypothetical protein
LQQPFYIGRGTSGDVIKSFIIPSGATRLFLGVLDNGGCNFDNSGGFSVTAVVADPPPPPEPGRVVVFAVADIALAGQSNGKVLNVGCGGDSASLNSPVDTRLALVPGKAVQFMSVSGTVNVNSFDSVGNRGPEGDINFNPDTAEAFGISVVRGPAGALVGVFLDERTPSPENQPQGWDFSSKAGRDTNPLAPSLRQVFYIGSGKTSLGTTKDFIIPNGAKRLFLGVLDNGGCNFDNRGSFQVTLTIPNSPPVLATVVDRAIDELTQLSFAVKAIDPDVPGQTLTFSLDQGAPSGASIEPRTGMFTWTPTEAQGPGKYPITVRVADNGTPNLSTNQTFTVTVNEVNLPPILAALPEQTIDEGVTLKVTVTASDPDLPANRLSFRLDASAPVGAVIDAATGVFSWTPGEIQGLSTNQITVRVTDDGSPNLSDTKTFTVVVREVNSKPTLSFVPSQSISAGSKLEYTLSATDPDWPPNTLTFGLDPGSPAGLTVDPASGLLSWAVSEAVAPQTNKVTVRVTDNGTPPFSDTKTFDVIVTPVPPRTNDNFANRAKLTGENVAVDVSNRNATGEVGEPMHAGRPGGKSLWWAWTASQTNAVTISTAGSSVDTLLAVYTGSAIGNLVPVASNDDDPSGGSTSLVRFSPKVGTEYQIAVDSFGAAEGSIKLTLTAVPPPPILRIERSGQNVIIWWPANAQGFSVESSGSLTPGSWTPVTLTPPPVLSGDSFSAKIPISPEARFYRLRKP